MIHALLIEFHKIRRLHYIKFLGYAIITVVFLTCIGLIAPIIQIDAYIPSITVWTQLLLYYTFITTMISPLFIGVLASRQVDIEHDGNGWILGRSVGVGPGRLCGAKLMMLSLIILPTLVIQTAVILLLGTLTGLDGEIGLQYWASYTAMLWLVDCGICAIHIYLSAIVKNQWESVLLGLIGSFIGPTLMRFPSVVNFLLPWGYFSLISHVAYTNSTLRYIQPSPWIAIGFFIGALIFFLIAAYRLSAGSR